MMTAPGAASASRISAGRSANALASSPGVAGISVPFILLRPRLAPEPNENTRVPDADALRSRKNTIGDSSSGSKATRSTAGAASRSAYSTRIGLPATWAARKSRSSSECARARKSMSSVPSATRANRA